MRETTFIATAVTSMLTMSSVALAQDPSTPPEACEPPCPTPAPAPTQTQAPTPAPEPTPEPTPTPAPQPPPPTPPVAYMPPTDEPTDYYGKPDMYSYAWYDPTLQTGIGVALQVGGGIGGFTDSTVSNLSSSEIGGVWQFRTTIGSHVPIGVDLAYNGTAYDLESIDGLTSDTLIGTDLEGAVRWNILPHYAWNPYIFAGVGWQHYDLDDNTLMRADDGIGSSDDLAVFPTGGGISYRHANGFTGDLRGTFRAAESSTFIEDINGDDASLHTWEVSAGIGYEL